MRTTSCGPLADDSSWLGNISTQEPERRFSTDSASELLACYQAALIYILHARDIPGISANELENFRSGSRISAYTCRLRLCPRATVGFESAGARDEHEIGHARKFRCTFASCQYPAFYSSQTLKRHMREKHSTIETPQRTIRRPGTRYQRGNDGGLGILSQSDRPPNHRRDKVKDSTFTPRAHNSHSDHTERSRPLTSGGNHPSFNSGDTVAHMKSVTRPQAGLTETHAPQRDDERQSLSHTYGGRVQAMAKGPMEHASHIEDLKQQDDEQQVLFETEKAEIEAMVQELMQNATYEEELRMVQDFQNRLTTDELEQMEAKGGDRLVMAFQKEAKKRYMMARLDQARDYQLGDQVTLANKPSNQGQFGQKQEQRVSTEVLQQSRVNRDGELKASEDFKTTGVGPRATGPDYDGSGPRNDQKFLQAPANDSGFFWTQVNNDLRPPHGKPMQWGAPLLEQFPSSGGMPATKQFPISGATARYERYDRDVRGFRGWMRDHTSQGDARDPTDTKRHNLSPFQAGSALAPPNTSTASPRATIMPMTGLDGEGTSGQSQTISPQELSDSTPRRDFTIGTDVIDWGLRVDLGNYMVDSAIPTLPKPAQDFALFESPQAEMPPFPWPVHPDQARSAEQATAAMVSPAPKGQAQGDSNYGE